MRAGVCLSHYKSCGFLTAELRARISAREGNLEVECLSGIPFLFQMGLFWFQVYFWMIWLPLKPHSEALLNSEWGPVCCGGCNHKPLCVLSKSGVSTRWKEDREGHSTMESWILTLNSLHLACLNFPWSSIVRWRNSGFKDNTVSKRERDHPSPHRKISQVVLEYIQVWATRPTPQVELTYFPPKAKPQTSLIYLACV